MIKWLKAAALTLLALLLTGAALIIKILRGRAEKAEEKARACQEALEQITSRAIRAKQAAKETAAAKEKADNERESLAATPDSGLLSRANQLFK
jgi:hypothetical protein